MPEIFFMTREYISEVSDVQSSVKLLFVLSTDLRESVGAEVLPVTARQLHNKIDIF